MPTPLSQRVSRLIALGMLAGLMLSYPLWGISRLYPLTPVVNALSFADSALLSRVVFGLMLTLLMVILARPAWRWPKLLLLCAASIECLGDQSRLQPWFYQYCLFNFALCVGRDSETQGLDACRFILGATYFWSGIQKIHVDFATQLFPWLISPLTGELSDNSLGFAFAAAVIAVALEALAGIALLTQRFRRPAVVFLIAMHLFILLCIGPFGHRWNSVVWPWNLAMVGLLLLLFWDFRGNSREIFKQGSFSASVILILYGFCPLLSLSGWWDSYLSSALYSPRVCTAVVTFGPSTKNLLPTWLQDVSRSQPDGSFQLRVLDWSLQELNAPPYPEHRVLFQAGKRFCEVTRSAKDVVIEINGKPHWWTGQSATDRLTCRDFGA